MPRFVKTFTSPNVWGVKKGPCKKCCVFGENWQRNHFPKLTTFTPMLQLCHSALGPIFLMYMLIKTLSGEKTTSKTATLTNSN